MPGVARSPLEWGLFPPELRFRLVGHLARIPGWVEGEFDFYFIDFGDFHEMILDILFDDRKEWAAHGGEGHSYVRDAVLGKGGFINQPEVDEGDAEFGILHLAKLIFYESFDIP